MATLAELRDEISVILKQRRNNVYADQITQAIKDAIAYHNVSRMFFTDGSDRFETSNGVANYALPPDLGWITHAQMFWGGSNYTTMHRRNWNWYLEINQDASQLRSVPSTYYSVREREIWLYPTPPGSFSVDIYYNRLLEELVGDDDQNAWTNEGRLVIRSRALYDLYTNVTQQADFAAQQIGFEAQYLERLQTTQAMNTGSETLTPMRW